ncbi:hypothetical protein OQA88_5813 [Cercophora sp. LCS_1]
MSRLSLDSSRHLAPPYQDDGEFWEDWPRQAARAALKAVGLPASYEVGVLTDVVRHLRSQLEGAFGVGITEAVFTASHLVALYQDDLEDVAAHLGLRYVTPRREFHPLVWESSSAYAGHGRGLCKAWWNDTECALEPMPKVSLLSVHYSQTALTVALAAIWDAGGLWEPEYRHSENFSLGRDAMSGYATEELYWQEARRQVLAIMEEYPYFPKPDLVMVTGDAVERAFLENLEAALLANMGRVPEILSDQPVVVAARGAAEFMRRGPAPWSQ